MITEKRFQKPIALSRPERDEIKRVLREFLYSEEDLLFAYIFGSFVKEEPFRDIDIAVYSKDKKGFLYQSDLGYRCILLTGYLVEIILLNDAGIGLRMNVLKGGELLFSKDEDLRTDFIERTGKSYIEYAHFRNIFLGIDGMVYDRP